MLRKYLKKSTALVLTAFTMLTGSCISNINAMDAKKEKPSNINKYLKYTIAYALPCTIALVGGFNRGKQTEDAVRSRSERLDVLTMLEDYKNIDKLSKEDKKRLIEEALEGTISHDRAFESHAGKNVMIISWMPEKIDGQFILRWLDKGEKIVFLSGIIQNNIDMSMRNIIYLAELQKLYPEQVIILKGHSEIIKEHEIVYNFNVMTMVKKYLLKNKICSKGLFGGMGKMVSKIAKFLDNLPLGCEIVDEGSKKVYAISYYSPSSLLFGGKPTRKRLLNGNVALNRRKIETILSEDPVYVRAVCCPLIRPSCLEDNVHIRRISVERDGIELSKIN